MCERSQSEWTGGRQKDKPVHTWGETVAPPHVLFSSHLTKVSWSRGVWGSDGFFFLLNTSESNEDEWKSNRAFWLLHLIEIASVQIQQSDARCQRWHPRLRNILKVWNKFWLFLLMLTESLAPQRSPLLLEHLYERLHLQFQGFLNWRQTTFYFNLSFRLSVRYPVCRWAQGRSKSVTVGASDIMTSFIHSNGRDILYLLSATTNGERFARQPTANLNTNILQVKADPATEVSNSDEVKRERNSPRTP